MPHNPADDRWPAGSAPVAVVMISLNEGHNMEGVLDNLAGWAREVFLVDSYSQDDTVDIALRRGVHVVQRRFKGFGDQWNFALRELPINAPFTMKLDPDERLSDELKANLSAAMARGDADGFSIERRLWFLNTALPVREKLIRLWKTGKARFTNVAVNEHPIIDGSVDHVAGDLEHYDSPDLDHWLEKQNRYTTAEAVIAYQGDALAMTPLLFGSALQRRVWAKKNYARLPFRYQLIFLYFWLWRGAWRAGWAGYASARMWCEVYRLIEYKRREMEITGRLPVKRLYGPGAPDERVQQFG
jgi:glycosyltransferase involved in cell wall biosynthesis